MLHVAVTRMKNKLFICNCYNAGDIYQRLKDN